MQFKNQYRNVAFLLLSLFLAATACNKPTANSVLGADDNGGYASDASRIELFTDDAISLMDIAGSYNNYNFIADKSLVNVPTDTFSNPHVVKVVFNANQDCICQDGRKRRGTILVSFYKGYNDTGVANMHTITFSDYYVDGYQVTGSIQYYRIDTTVIGNWYYRVYVNDTVNVSPGNYESWKGTLARQWIAGDSTGTRTDDVFSISGIPTLTRPDAHQFIFNIATPLQLALNYNFVESGSVNVVGPDGPRVLNYGNGNPDNLAWLYIGTNSYQTTLTY